MKNLSQQELGTLLVGNRIITEDHLTLALKLQEGSQKPLTQILVEQNFINELDLADFLSKQLCIERLNLADIELRHEVTALFNKMICTEYVFVPISRGSDTLTIAISYPLNRRQLRDISKRCECEIDFVLTTRQEILSAITKEYGETSALSNANEYSDKLQQANDDEGTDILNNNAPVSQLLDSFIESAVSLKASDIHIEPSKSDLIVRFRVDGVLREHHKLKMNLHAELVNRIKVVSGMNTIEKRKPQDGRFSRETSTMNLDIRVSTLPTTNGEKAVLRILDRQRSIPKLDELGFTSLAIDTINKVSKRPQGLIVTCGPTGSGKSTTLASLLSLINSKDKNIITIEDPVEYELEGVNQVSISATSDMTFASVLRSILRQDPDIIMIGEVRDKETAQIAISSALTGHLVLTTIHTNDAVGVISRFEDMGIEPYLLADALTCVVAQRLVRKVCPHCCKEIEATETQQSVLNLNKCIKIKETAGCKLCNNIGYSGREGCFEILEVDSNIRSLISRGKNEAEIRNYLKSKNIETMKGSCIEKVKQGITDMKEFYKICFE